MSASVSPLPADRPRPHAPVRDPAFAARVFWLSLALVLLWPLGVATEFRLWVLWAPENRKVTADFLGSFWPLVYNAEFMQMVARETWRTVAMATAGVTLALVLAVPLSLLATRVLRLVWCVCNTNSVFGDPFRYNISPKSLTLDFLKK